MALRIRQPVPVPASVAQGAAVDVKDSSSVTLYLSGIFVATVQWQVSDDGTNWVNSGAAQTAPGAVTIAEDCMFVRADTTAFTSGAPVGAAVLQHNS